jgi:hypothetical protein
LWLGIIRQRLLAAGRKNARTSLSSSPMLPTILVSGHSQKSKSDRWIIQLVMLANHAFILSAVDNRVAVAARADAENTTVMALFN